MATPFAHVPRRAPAAASRNPPRAEEEGEEERERGEARPALWPLPAHGGDWAPLTEAALDDAVCQRRHAAVVAAAERCAEALQQALTQRRALRRAAEAVARGGGSSGGPYQRGGEDGTARSSRWEATLLLARAFPDTARGHAAAALRRRGEGTVPPPPPGWEEVSGLPLPNEPAAVSEDLSISAWEMLARVAGQHPKLWRTAAAVAAEKGGGARRQAWPRSESGLSACASFLACDGAEPLAPRLAEAALLLHATAAAVRAAREGGGGGAGVGPLDLGLSPAADPLGATALGAQGEAGGGPAYQRRRIRYARDLVPALGIAAFDLMAALGVGDAEAATERCVWLYARGRDVDAAEAAEAAAGAKDSDRLRLLLTAVVKHRTRAIACGIGSSRAYAPLLTTLDPRVVEWAEAAPRLPSDEEEFPYAAALSERPPSLVATRALAARAQRLGRDAAPEETAALAAVSDSLAALARAIQERDSSR